MSETFLSFSGFFADFLCSRLHLPILLRCRLKKVEFQVGMMSKDGEVFFQFLADWNETV